MDRQGYGRRIEQALLDRQSQIGERLTLEWLGQETAKAEKRPEGPYTQAAVSAWLSERNQPGLRTFEALAKVLGAQPEWLAFGIHTGELPPSDRKRKNANGS